MATPTEDWNRLLRDLLAGDKLAFLKINRLISGFLGRLRAYDFRDEWEDLRQEVVLSLVANVRAGRLRDPEKLVGYLRIITRNKFADRLQRKTRQREREREPLDEAAAAAPEAGDRSTEARVRDVWWEVDKLPSQHQQVIDGVYRQGKTYEEVAEDTGIPLGTVKRRLRESLQTLRDRLRDDDG